MDGWKRQVGPYEIIDWQLPKHLSCKLVEKRKVHLATISQMFSICTKPQNDTYLREKLCSLIVPAVSGRGDIWSYKWFIHYPIHPWNSHLCQKTTPVFHRWIPRLALQLLDLKTSCLEAGEKDLVSWSFSGGPGAFPEGLTPRRLNTPHGTMIQEHTKSPVSVGK